MTYEEARAALQAVNLTHLAEASGLPRRTLQRIKAGKVKPHNSTLTLIATALIRGAKGKK